MNTCPHDMGWSSINDQHIFVHSNGEVDLGLKRRRDRGLSFVQVRCNYPGCLAIRNVQIKSKMLVKGKIGFRKRK